MRPSAVPDAICAWPSSVGIEEWKLSVWKVPHTIAFTRIPRGPYSSADCARRAR